MNAALQKSRPHAAFTLFEMIVVILLLALILAPLFTANLARGHHGGPRITCFNHLKQIGTAYRIWANDHHDSSPFETSQADGGWSEIVARGNAGPFCWTNYAILASELGEDTHVLVCPLDERKPATNFWKTWPVTNNLAVSYFVGVNGDRNTNAHGILAGDRNLNIGADQNNGYGLSPPDGRGNDALLNSASYWTRKIHSAGQSLGIGNILLADGSAQQTTSPSLRDVWLKNASATNHIPVRLVFP